MGGNNLRKGTLEKVKMINNHVIALFILFIVLQMTEEDGANIAVGEHMILNK